MLVGNEKAAGNHRGPITALVTRLAEQEGPSDWLIMPGRVPHEDVERWYSLIDIAPFPRKAQAVTELVAPLKPLEALAMEKAVVVSSVRAMAEMVTDGQTGLVFQKDNVADLVRTLARLIDDPVLRSNLGRAGRHWVQTERTWRHMGDRVKAWRRQPQTAAAIVDHPGLILDIQQLHEARSLGVARLPEIAAGSAITYQNATQRSYGLFLLPRQPPLFS